MLAAKEKTDLSTQQPSTGVPKNLRLGRFSTYVWVWPMLIACVLLAVSPLLSLQIESLFEQSLRDNLVFNRDEIALAIEHDFDTHGQEAQYWADHPEIREGSRALLKLRRDEEADPGEMRLIVERLRAVLIPYVQAMDHAGFMIIARDGAVIAAQRDEALDITKYPWQSETYFAVYDRGEPCVSRPYLSDVPLPDLDGGSRTRIPTMIAAAPIRNELGETVAAFALRLRPDRHLFPLLKRNLGESGESYLFDRNGLMLTESRFNDQLKQIGLLENSPHAHSALHLTLRDPQVNLLEGGRLANVDDLPFTRMVTSAIRGESDVDLTKYRDYRGVNVVGAWMWLPEYGLGIATKIEHEEAYTPIQTLRLAYLALVVLLMLSSTSILVFSYFHIRLRKAARAAIAGAQRFGQYEIETLVGKGGMATVYRARHGMLRRPAAVKLIEAEHVTDTLIRRFEREALLASQLNHPNTVRVFDYGVSEEGLFYYAMELIEGITLETLVARCGPLPQGRAILIARQLCGALIEAHSLGVIHRDIKPANVMLCRYSGMSDFVKLFDFGIGKVMQSQDAALTRDNVLVGTPEYMSPESIVSPDLVDTRTDIYSFGMLLYYLLCGKLPFVQREGRASFLKALSEKPMPLSEQLDAPIDPRLERLVMRCIERDPARRPQSIAEIRAALSDIAVGIDDWSFELAAQWWDEYASEMTAVDDVEVAGTTCIRETPTGVMPDDADVLAQTH